MLDIIPRLTRSFLRWRRSASLRVVGQNFLSLSLLQYASYLFPLITVPYLTRVVGVSKFGEIAFAQGTVAYICMVVNFGFPFSATRQITLAKQAGNDLRPIFTDVTWAKVLLAALGLAALVLFIASIRQFREEYLLFLATSTIVLGYVFNAEWFFQGVEDMHFVTLAGLTSRAISTVLVFAVVRSSADYWLVPLLFGTGMLMGSLLGLVFVWRRYGIACGKFNISGVWRQVTHGWDNFLSSAFISLYTTSNVFVLGLLTTNVEVGYYSAAEKIVSAIRSVWTPVPQVLYPYFTKKFSVDPINARFQLRKVVIFSAAVTLAMSLVGCLLGEELVRIYLGQSFAPSARILKILVFVVFLIGVSNVLGIQGLLANGLTKPFRNIVVISGVMNIILLVGCIKLFGVIGPAISVVVVETFVVCAQWRVLRKNNTI